MAINYGFFNSVDGDRTYNADDMSNYFEGLVGNGVYATVGNACIVKSLGGLTLSVGTGRAIINNKWVKITTPQICRITPHANLNRYDAICLQLNSSGRNIQLSVIEGTPGTSPGFPEKTSDQLVLAHIYVRANTTSISQSDITDRRPIKTYCGWVTGLVDQVNTSELFLQFETACEEKQQEIEAWQKAQTSDFENWKKQQMSTITEEVTELQTWIANQKQSYEEWQTERTSAFEEWQSEKKTAFNLWFNNLTETLTVNVNPASSQIYEAETNESGYASLPFIYNDNQTVLVYINGIFATADKDYTINNGGIQLVSNEFTSGNDIVTFVVFKAGVVMGGSSGTADDLDITKSDIDGVISEIEEFNN